MFKVKTFKRIHDQENAEQINNMIAMSPIQSDTNVRVRFYKNTSSDDATDTEPTISGVGSTELTEPDRVADNTDQEPKLYQFTRICKSIHENLSHLDDQMQVKTFKKCTRNEWLLVANLVDKAFLLVYCFIVIMVTSLVFRK